MRGVLISSMAKLRKQWKNTLDDLMIVVKQREGENKLSPTTQTSTLLQTARLSLRNHLLQDWNHKMHKCKAHLYNTGNKVGAHLARQ